MGSRQKQKPPMRSATPEEFQASKPPKVDPKRDPTKRNPDLQEPRSRRTDTPPTKPLKKK